ncbi:MAG: L-threonylcarbamoyladenylate synthase [Ilumatobacteraceae bacterium]
MGGRPVSEILIDGFDASSVDLAAATLRNGGLVAIPTETVYGLAADADNETALRRVFAVKGRPANHPLILHIGADIHLDEWSRDITPAARELAHLLWPGPLTMLLHRPERVSLVATGGRDTVALRVPDHVVALNLLKLFDGALAAPSANRFGKVSPTTAKHVLADLGSDVDLILDGGACFVGVESTIVDMTRPIPQLLRPGGISVAQIEAILNLKIDLAASPPRAPGMLESHYAPDCAVELVDSSHQALIRAQQLRLESMHVAILDYSHDVDRYARIMYQFLRDADRQDYDVVVAVMPTEAGIGRAIRDRLSKAAIRS